MKNLPQNNLEKFNEVFIFSTIYFTFIFTNFVDSAQARYDVGWIFIGIIVGGLFVNFVVIGMDVYDQIRIKIL